MITKGARLVRSIMLPSYAMVRALLRTLPGTSKRAVRGMITAIYQETGTPDDQVRWNNPDKWITDRLSGEDARVAQLIWQGSGKTVNPRYIYSGYLFINGLVSSAVHNQTISIGRAFCRIVPNPYQ